MFNSPTIRLILLTLTALVVSATPIEAREPIYVVNGTIVESIKDIPQEDIESIDVLPADEQTIAKWGTEASNGVILVTLRYDTPASFNYNGTNNYTDYLASTVKWSSTMPAERVSLRIVVKADGRAEIGEVLDSTSRQFLKRVTRAIDTSPLWSPALRDGKAVESQHLVNLKLPAGKELPIEQGIILL